MAAAACAVKDCDFAAGPSGAGLLCSRCAGEADAAEALATLAALGGLVSSGARRQWALDLARKDAAAKELLRELSAAKSNGEARPLVVVHPPPRASGGAGPAGTLTLACEAVSFGGEAPAYQWYKDGQPVSRAQRNRLVLCCAGPADEGSYACEARNAAGAALSRASEVRLSESSASARRRFESPLRRAGEAAAAGDAAAAERLLSEAEKAAELHSERAHAEVLCSRAELLLGLGRWADAWAVARRATDLLPGLARAHAVAGAAAAQLGNLAEAACSWETADLLGGVPSAAAEAEACRQRLEAFFAERREKAKEHEASQPQGSGAFGGGARAEEDEDMDEDEEMPTGAEPGARWREQRRQHWRGSAGGATFRRRPGSRPMSPPRLPPELQRQLAILGLAVEGSQRPAADEVRRAYRRRALELHPDKGGSKAAFQELQSAYEAALKALGGA